MFIPCLILIGHFLVLLSLIASRALKWNVFIFIFTAIIFTLRQMMRRREKPNSYYTFNLCTVRIIFMFSICYTFVHNIQKISNIFTANSPATHNIFQTLFSSVFRNILGHTVT